jgi:hypothetical protein
MPLTVPPTTLAILEEIESARQPTVDYEIAGKLSGLHQADGLTEAERRGAWAEASAFIFTLVPESPWHTHYGPVFTATKADGTPYYAPDIVMQLAQNIEIENVFLHKSLEHLRSKSTITADTILAVLDESPVFAAERRPLLKEGIHAYLDGDHTKAIHVIVPQIEQALRQLLSLTGAPTLKTGRNGMMQLKNLNDILREPAIKTCVGEDLRLYLLTFLADERGQNIRNTICHGLATPQQFNQGLGVQTLHALLAISLVRQKSPPATQNDNAKQNPS